MNVPLAPLPPTSARRHVFTLGSALRWLGHDCPDHRSCCAPIDTLRASVWFILRGPHCRGLPPHARVLVDDTEIGDTVASIRGLIYQVNGCTRRDGIEVRYEPRCTGDRPDRLVPQRVPVALLTRYRPTRPVTMVEPNDGDLRTIVEAAPW